jgi:predicted  nucleic acid-binding Zn-ribbon protein
VLHAEHRAADLQHDLRLLEKLSSDALRAMSDTQKEVSQVQEEIARIYAGVCERNHQVRQFLRSVLIFVAF